MNKQTCCFKHKLLSMTALPSIVVVAGLVTGGLDTVYAQAAEANSSNENAIEEVIVIGIRERGLQEVKNKREKNVIFDGLSADSVSGVPDFNLADALRRIVGVSAEFDEDEGEFVNVRGINAHLNRVTFDGMTLPTTGRFGGSGRNVNLGFLPSILP